MTAQAPQALPTHISDNYVILFDERGIDTAIKHEAKLLEYSISFSEKSVQE